MLYGMMEMFQVVGGSSGSAAVRCRLRLVELGPAAAGGLRGGEPQTGR